MRLAVLVALGALLSLPAAASAADPKPKTGKTVVVKRASGTVLVKERGKRSFTRLGRARAVPVGSTIDATNGTVNLTSTKNSSGSRRQSAAFYDGAFKVSQKRSRTPMTDIDLIGGDFSGCAAERRPGGVFKSGSTRRRLWGRGKGRFRTRGRNGSATVRGTTWLTEDGCAGTRAFAKDGEVQAEADGVDLERLLEPGQSVIFYCNTDGVPGVSDLYCMLVLSQPAKEGQPFDLFGFGFATVGTPEDVYNFCVVYPDQQAECGEFPFAAADADGIKAGGIGCVFSQQGTHYAGWALQGQVLEVPLPFEVSATESPFCVSEPPRPGIDTPVAKNVPPDRLRLARAAARGD